MWQILRPGIDYYFQIFKTHKPNKYIKCHNLKPAERTC